MKRLLGFVFTVMLVVSFASAEKVTEISFQNIPWLSNDVSVAHILTEAGLLRNEVEFVFSHENALYPIKDNAGFVSPDIVTGVDEVTFSSTIESEVEGKIAGYPVKDLIFTFAYNGEYKLIAVKVELIKGNYDDLKAKLTKVYGEGEHKETEEGIWSTVWKGSNNSAVILYTQSEGLDYTLIYGRLDAAEILSSCLAPADPDDVSGL